MQDFTSRSLNYITVNPPGAPPAISVGCDAFNCSLPSLSSPGANIASPIAMSLVGILGNAIAIATLRHTPVVRHRTVFFVFVAGLAWADLIGIVITTFPVLIVYSYGRWVGGAGLCNYHAFSMISMGLLTPLIVCAMAVERYIGIRHGYFYMRNCNAPRAKICLLTLCLVSILFAALPLFGFGEYAVQYPGTWCFLNLHTEHAVDAAYSVTFAVMNLLLIGTMIICNVVVQCTLLAMRCRRKSAGAPNQFRRTHRSRQQQELEIQMVVLLMAITLVFTLCWAPLQVQILLNQLVPHLTADDHSGDLLAIRLASINQLLDPWVYILCKKPCNCWKVLFLGRLSHRFSSRRSSHNQASNLHLKLQRASISHPLHATLRMSQKLLTSPQDGAVVKIHSEEDLFTASQRHYLKPTIISTQPAKHLTIAAGEPSLSLHDSGTSSIDNSAGKAIGDNEQNTPNLSSDAMNSSCRCISVSVPIPVFYRSQYSIRRNQRGAVAAKSSAYRSRLYNASLTAVVPECWPCRMASVPSEYPGPFSVSQKGFKRRHSWCGTDPKHRAKYCRTQSTQTIPDDGPLICW